MPYTIALIAIFAAVVVLFSKEFGDIGQKIWKMKGMKLLLPLFAASYFAVALNEWLENLVAGFQDTLHADVYWLKDLLGDIPFAMYLAAIIIMLGVLLIAYLIPFAYKKVQKAKMPFGGEVTLFLWVFALSLIILP